MSAVTIAPPSPELIPARHQGGRQTPTLSVIHGTVSHDDPGTARQIAEWWHGPTSPVTSAHYVIDPKAILQCVPDHRIAFHCGYNAGSIGWELCDEQVGPASRWNDADSKAIIARAQENIARAHLAYGIPIRMLSDEQLRAWDRGGRKAKDGGIVTHAQMSRVFHKSTHTDPRDLNIGTFVAGVRVASIKIVAAAQGPVPVVPPHRAPKRPVPVPKRLSVFYHLPASVVYREDSMRGVRHAAKSRGDARAIDINTCGRTKDGILVAGHWSQPLLHGFKWAKGTPARLRNLPKTTHIRDLTMADLRHLVAPGGYRIRSLKSLVDLAARLGVRVEIEAKGARTLEKVDTWREVAGWPSSRALLRKGLLQGKTLVLIPGAPKRIRAMHGAGIPTIVSTTDAKSNVLRLADYAGQADYVRGPVKWVA